MTENIRCLVVVAAGNGIGHVEHHRIQYRVGNVVDVIHRNRLSFGIHTDFFNFRYKSGHQAAAGENQMLRCTGINILIHGAETTPDPIDQVALVLNVKLYGDSMCVQRPAEFFIGLIRFVLQKLIDEHQAAVFGKVLQNTDESVSGFFSKLKEVTVGNDHHSALRHHGHGLYCLGKLRHTQCLSIELMVIEFLKACWHQCLFQCAQIVFPEIAFLTMEDINLSNLTV